MRNLKRLSLVSLVSVALLSTMALPASAADVTGDTNTATVVVEAGYLVLNTTDAEVTFTKVESSVSTTQTTATLTGVTVSDLNSNGLGWTSTASISELTVGEDSEKKTIDTTTARFTSEITDQKGTAGQVTAGTNKVSAADGGNNSAVWTTSVEIDVPNTTIADTYQGTLTHSLL